MKNVSTGNRGAEKNKSGTRVSGSKKIVHKMLPPFSRQLAALLHAGMPIVSALEALEEQSGSPSFSVVVSNIRKDIESGRALSEAFSVYPGIFSNLYCNIISGGESSGRLPEALSRLADFLEAAEKLRRKVHSAMAYPTVVLCMAFLITALLIVFVVPGFANMFEELGAKLPYMTRKLMELSKFVRDNGIIILIVVALASYGLGWWKRTPSGALTIDQFKLRAPLFGTLCKKLVAARFARTFGELISSGVPILRSIEIGAGATGNRVAENVLFKAKDTVEKGEPLSVALQKQTVFPLLMVRMFEAGEKSGKIDTMSSSVADFYDDEIDAALSALTSIIEPVLMIFLGIIIGGIVTSLFLPIFRLASVISG